MITEIKIKVMEKVKVVHTLAHTVFRSTIVSVSLSVGARAGSDVILYRAGDN